MSGPQYFSSLEKGETPVASGNRQKKPWKLAGFPTQEKQSTLLKMPTNPHPSFLNKFLDKKSNRLGIYDGPMASSTVALHGLNHDSAIHLVERKINRARRAGSTEIRIVHEKNDSKLRRLLIEYLSQTPHVAEFKEDDANAAVVLVKLI